MRKFAFLALLVGAISLVIAGMALAVHTTPGPADSPTVVEHDGSGPGGGQWDCAGGIKLDPPSAGTYVFTNFDIGGGHIVENLTLVVSYSNKKLTFQSTTGEFVTDVFVKGGPKANWYEYDPWVEHDDGLVPPTNPNNDKPYGFSHVCFYFDKN
jgi:hypothetical protein